MAHVGGKYMRCDVLYQADQNYIVYGGVSILSLFENNKDIDELIVHFLSSGNVDSIRKDIQTMATSYGREVIFYDTEELKEWLNDQNVTIHDGSYGTYYKLFFERFLPDDIHRLFYLDDDTLVLGDISELFEMEMNKVFGIALDSAPHLLKNMKAEEMGIDIYNCGTMLINVDLWKAKGVESRIIECMKNSDLYFHDQDIINRFFGDEIQRISCKYNLQPLHYGFRTEDYYKVFCPNGYYDAQEVESAKQDIRVAHFFHFCGESAWNKNTCHPYGKLFKQYYLKSPWNNSFVLSRKKLSRVQRVEKILYYVLPGRLFLTLWRAMMIKNNHLYVKK